VSIRSEHKNQLTSALDAFADAMKKGPEKQQAAYRDLKEAFAENRNDLMQFTQGLQAFLGEQKPVLVIDNSNKPLAR
jgi:hypothetical protein